MRTDTRNLRHDYAQRRDGVEDQRSIIKQRTDIRADAKDVHEDRANLRSNEQNLRAQRNQLSAERQDLRKDEGARRANGSGDLRYASAGDLRSGQEPRLANNRVREPAGQGDRAWRERGASQEVSQRLTAANLANHAAATQKKSVNTQQLHQKWYRYVW